MHVRTIGKRNAKQRKKKQIGIYHLADRAKKSTLFPVAICKKNQANQLKVLFVQMYVHERTHQSISQRIDHGRSSTLSLHTNLLQKCTSSLPQPI